MSEERGVEYLKQVASYCVEKGGHDKTLSSFKVTGGGNGRCIGEFTVTKEMVNVYGGLHGGFTASMVDNVTTYALLSANAQPGVSVDLHVSYLTSAKVGEEIVVDANVVKVGQKLAFLECVLKKKSDDTVIAKGGQTKYVEAKPKA